MQIIEKFTQGKRQDQQLNEDALVITPHFVAVIDGATAKSDMTWPQDMTSARFAAQTIASAFESLVENATLQETVLHISAYLQNEYTKLNKLEELTLTPVHRPSAALACYSIYHQELWLIGDCQALVDGKHYQDSKHIDMVTAEARSAFMHGELYKGATIESLRENDLGNAFIKPLLQRQMEFQNKPFVDEWAYYVIDGFAIPEEALICIKISPETELVLASDGYPILCNTLAESEEKLAYVLKEDPLCIDINKQAKGFQPGHHSFDDRSYVRLVT